MKELIQNNYHHITEATRFILVGIINTIVGYGTYFVLLCILHYLFASVIGSIVGILCSYFLNKTWTFKSDRKINLKDISKFYTLYGLSWIISLLLLTFGVEIIKISPAITGLLVIPVSTAINYLGQKFWIFKKTI